MLDNGLQEGKQNMFAAKEYVQIYTTCYDMCTQRSPYNWSRDLYQRHGETIENYLVKTVRPALQDKVGQGGTILLTELQYRWSNHQIMNKWLKKFFTYLDRYYVKHHSLPTLSQAGLKHFKTVFFSIGYEPDCLFERQGRQRLHVPTRGTAHMYVHVPVARV
jgi:cullin 1